MARSPRRRRRIKKRTIAVALIASGVAGGIAGRVSHVMHQRPTSAPSASVVASARAPRALELVESVFDSRLGAGWQDWGWGHHDMATPGPARIVFAGYAGIVFHHASLPSDFGGVTFRFRAPTSWAPFLSVSLKHAQQDDATFPTVDVTDADIVNLSDGWREVWIAWTRLNPRNLPIDRVVIAAARQVGPEWVELDKVALTKREGPLGKPPVRDAQLTILCDQQATPISPMIYGITMGAWGSNATAHRVGGNPITRLNWELGAAWNAGKDWFFENGSGQGNVWEWINDATAHHAVTAISVPMIGWVAKDTTSVGFPVAKFGKQRVQDPYRAEAGNGIALDGTKIRPGPPTETSVAAPPERIAKWITALREKDRARGTRSVYEYILDNEPSLWNEVHRDVHPDPVTQDELLDRTLRYAKAIRTADPETLIAGPAEWGWSGYFYSAKDREVGVPLRPDRRAHGDVPVIAWYLKKLADAEKSTGVRYLDTLDLHFYPQAERVFGTNARTDREGSQLRIRATRGLWDPRYVDESWINEPVRLIPRMREWVAQNYPGIKTSIGEWSFGADDHISGALATAEALGRFGEQGLDSAFYWGGPMPNSKSFWAFRAYRDFDGAGGRFLDFSLRTRSYENMSLFASRDATGTHIVAVILNLDPSFAVRAHISLDACGKVEKRRAFSYTAESKAIEPEPEGDTDLVESMPPYSIRILDLQVAKPAAEGK